MIEAFVGLLKLIRNRSCFIDERIFRLHCLFTSMILFFFFIVMTTKQIAGDPIDCDTNRDSVKPSVLNTFCLIHYTYTIREGFYKRLGIDVVAPGVKYGPKHDEIHYNYYQWIWFLFFVEAIFFYIPRYLWKGWESGTIAHLVTNVTGYMNEEVKKTKQTKIVNYLITCETHTKYYSRHYFYCLLLAFFNVFLQILFINFLFNGEFYLYGLNVFFFLYEDPDIRRDELIKVFPRVTKCRFHKFGSSGSIQDLDALCVLPLNMYNEIIFVFLWFWFIFLAFLLFLSIVTKIILKYCKMARLYYINREFQTNISWKKTDDNYMDPEEFRFGETLILVLIKQNTGLMFAKELVNQWRQTKWPNKKEQEARGLQEKNQQDLRDSQYSQEQDDNMETHNEETSLIEPNSIIIDMKKVGSESN